MIDHFVRILATTANETLARKIAIELVELRLAACVQRTPIISVYRWKGQKCESSEIELAIKTCTCCLNAIKKVLHEDSSYDITQILVCPILHGDEKYLQWLQSNIACTQIS
ncbi:MAG: divalent-cation tolerance protein CutA, partial [Helicobacter sp.]|nr:divalent-cation tolerance protein CutA [Helicobacter sp.]